jgi:hypothetical protein
MKNGLQTLSEQLHTGIVVERPDYAVSFEELNEVVGFTEARNLEQRFVAKGADPTRH